jgi:plastocyanin
VKKLVLLALTAALVLVVLALPALAAGPTVKVKDDKFSPKTLTVKHGKAVTFKFAGKSLHNVSVKKGPVKFHSPNKKTGSYVVKFAKKGTYRIVCTLHSSMGMKMKVVVK